MADYDAAVGGRVGLVEGGEKAQGELLRER
jgi:hypothetical protein